MKTASMALGIIGGVISILFGLFLVLGGVMFTDDSLWENTYDTIEEYDQMALATENTAPNDLAATVFLAMGIGSVAAGVLGLVGGIIVKRKNTAAGVMMIIAAVLSLFAFFNLVSLILFVLGGIFALKREPQPAMPPYQPMPPYPYYQYPQYPPVQPYYPQYPYPPQPSAPPTENPPEPPQQQ